MKSFISETVYFKIPTLPQTDIIKNENNLDKAFLEESSEGEDQEFEDEIDELHDKFATYLRCYKMIGKKSEVYKEIQASVCMPVIEKYLKETLSLR